MKNNYLIITVLIMSISSVIYAQTESSPDNRLLAKYSTEYLSNLQETQPQMIEYLNFELNNGFTFVDIPEEKAEQFPYLRYFNGKEQGDIVEEIPTGSLNLALYEYERNYSSRTTYRIGSNQAIVFYSIKEMSELFNSSHDE
ncbi:MAG TPA: hypothetical protein P5509_07895 [Bacteroidales bacterium]|nr:hypothetical protein [Bacteroidales bacterium]